MMRLKMRVNGLTVSTWIFLASVAFSTEATAADDMVPGGICVADFNLGGLTNKEADQKVDEYINSTTNQTVTLNVDGTIVNTAAGELSFCWNNTDVITETTQQCEGGNLVRHYMNLKDLQMNPVALELETALDGRMVVSFMKTECNAVTAEAKDTSVTEENDAFMITPEVVGKTVDTDATRQALNETLDSGLNIPIVVTVVVEERLPAVTAGQLATVQNVLGISSTDSSSSGTSRSTNLKIGSGRINGRVLIPGETLSGYECMQPFTIANGYATAAAYENGQVVDNVSGGVYQVATTLHNTALLAKLEITQRQNHSMIVSYVEPSNDAAIAETYKDIRVTDSYDTPTYVEGGTSGRTLFFIFYGKETRPSGRIIKYVSKVLSVTDPEEPIIRVNPSLAPGVRMQERSAHRRLKSKLWKYTYMDSVETEKTILHTDTYSTSKTIIRTDPEVPMSTEPVEVPAGVPAESIPSSVTEGNGGPGVSAPQQEPPPSPGGPGA